MIHSGADNVYSPASFPPSFPYDPLFGILGTATGRKGRQINIRGTEERAGRVEADMFCFHHKSFDRTIKVLRGPDEGNEQRSVSQMDELCAAKGAKYSKWRFRYSFSEDENRGVIRDAEVYDLPGAMTHECQGFGVSLTEGKLCLLYNGM